MMGRRTGTSGGLWAVMVRSVYGRHPGAVSVISRFMGGHIRRCGLGEIGHLWAVIRRTGAVWGSVEIDHPVVYCKFS